MSKFKMTYKADNGTKAIVTVRGTLVDRNDGTASIEVTNMDAYKLALSLLVNGINDNPGFNAVQPTVLNKDTEEVLDITVIAVKTNCGPKEGVKTEEFGSSPASFVGAVARDLPEILIREPKAAAPAPESAPAATKIYNATEPESAPAAEHKAKKVKKA